MGVRRNHIPSRLHLAAGALLALDGGDGLYVCRSGAADDRLVNCEATP